MMNKRVNLVAATVVVLNMSSAWAQDPAASENTPAGQAGGDHADHSAAAERTRRDAKPGKNPKAAPANTSGDMEAMPGMNQGDKSGMASGKAGDMSTMNHGDGGMDMAPMQGGSAPPGARDPQAYSGGYDFGPIPRPRMGDEDKFGSLLIDRLESVRTRGNSSTAYDLQARFGRDYDRAVLKAEGDVAGGKLHARTELLWGHALATFWDTQLGARYDSGGGPDRRWLAFGVQGLAPYWFNVEATAYAGEQGRSAFRFAAEYELLLTQKLILQPRVEANFYGKRDAARALGSGLSDLSTGVRLRYEIRREFAPYIGVERAAKFGGTADYARAAGEDAKVTRFVAGVRFWY
ncbi:MAG: copper resistance protein B [Burkholderiales bacterium]